MDINQKKDRIKEMLIDGATYREIKDKLNTGYSTIRNCKKELANALEFQSEKQNNIKGQTKQELTEELGSDSYVKDLSDSEIKRSYTILKKKYNDLLDNVSSNNKMEEVWQQTQRHGKGKIEKKRGETKSESIANIVLSDWHIEEPIDPNTINGINEYNTEIAKQRATAVFQNGLELIDMLAKDENIKNVNFALLGDFISGYIHPELLESNEMSPTEAILFAKDLITSGIDLFLNESDYDISVVTAFGNHGRTTDKKRISTGWKNSYEWMLYVLVAQQYLGNDRIKFKIEKGYHNFQQQFDKVLRHHHGDGIKYRGGVGGITIPLNKAIAQWNKVKHADYDVIGHRHQRQNLNNAVINGSLNGYNAYAESIKAEYQEPQQALFLINSEFGKTITAPIFTK
ncbi:MAG TPA: hypothetical protein PLP73_01205 [Candidatus Absconditabacterales bacterium]|nr:hypothetical protein [Candidatus Absconditabacterales bacterium]